jgi:phage tail P2-like protein
MTAISLLPPNATDLERALEAATARLGEVPVRLRDLWNPQTCPVAFLPWLAWAVSVDVWDEAWPEAVKRATIAASIPLHRIKGTVQAVKLSLAPLGLSSDVVEWFEAVPTGEPGTFKVAVRYDGSGPTVTLAMLRTMRRAIDRARPVSRAYGISLTMAVDGPLYVAGSVRLQVRARLNPHPAD